ncbi:hypothetical protein SAMN05444920_101863 [Nonomuraea solani]|uniref:Copper(I)-binding protein n=1 Tax=Nonomuraea solani TaxID=1144553 RepID=A0A1H5VGD8_9ACTN|nr:hypothetical protein [Nonomuraea solani]SEF85878.1 hypothetical protein SAMN05444920_101863 [Nonomuraea solani]
MRPIVFAMLVVTLAATGCSQAGLDDANRLPQNEGANADVDGGLHLRNVFLLGGTDPASPAPRLALYGVLLNEGGRPVQLERVTVEGGGSVQLAGPIALPPNQPVGTDSRPIGTASGVRGGSVPMTFTFQQGKTMRVNVPVMQRLGHYASLPPAT